MGHVVRAIFDNPGDATRAIDELHDAGVAPHAISVIGRSPGSEEAYDASAALAGCDVGDDECAYYQERLAAGGLLVAVDTSVDDFDAASALAILYSWRGESASDLRQTA